MKKIVCAFALLLTTTLFGSLHLQPGKWGIQAEFLYLYPSFDDTYYAITSSDVVLATRPIGRRHHNNFQFEPGFRIELARGLCCCGGEFHLRWTRLNGERKDSVTGDPFILPTQSFAGSNIPVFAGSADSKVKFHFNSVDGFYQRDIYLCCPLALALRVGLQWAEFDIHERSRYFVTGVLTETTKYRPRTWGLGPEFGFAADFSLNSCWECLSRWLCNSNLSVTFLATGSLLAAKTRSQFKDELVGNPTVNVKNDHLWRIVPAWHARLGLNWERCFDWCFCNGGLFSLEVGYEFTSYCRALAKVRYLDNVVTGTSLNYYSNFDMHGLYVAAGLVF